jgi:hypothetical protein
MKILPGSEGLNIAAGPLLSCLFGVQRAKERPTVPDTPRAAHAQGAPRAMSNIIRFPARNAAVIFVREAAEGGWVVLARDHGWLHGDRRSALADAQWLARNLGLSIREAP